MGRVVIETREPLLVNDIEAWSARKASTPLIVGEPHQVRPFTPPLMTGDAVFGRISLQNIDRINAFSESDVRLLTTLASSLSVALENARLFDETQRLLTETNERAAELAIINSVQQGLAEKLDMQSMYDLVGDKIQEIFDAQVVDIGLYDIERQVLHYPVRDRARSSAGASRRASPLGLNARALVADPRPIVIDDVDSWVG